MMTSLVDCVVFLLPLYPGLFPQWLLDRYSSYVERCESPWPLPHPSPTPFTGSYQCANVTYVFLLSGRCSNILCSHHHNTCPVLQGFFSWYLRTNHKNCPCISFSSAPVSDLLYWYLGCIDDLLSFHNTKCIGFIVWKYFISLSFVFRDKHELLLCIPWQYLYVYHLWKFYLWNGSYGVLNYCQTKNVMP